MTIYLALGIAAAVAGLLMAAPRLARRGAAQPTQSRRHVDGMRLCSP
jgi:hypothetical protein